MITLDRDFGRNEESGLPQPPRRGAAIRLIIEKSDRYAKTIRLHTQETSARMRAAGKEGNK